MACIWFPGVTERYPIDFIIDTNQFETETLMLENFACEDKLVNDVQKNWSYCEGSWWTSSSIHHFWALKTELEFSASPPKPQSYANDRCEADNGFSYHGYILIIHLNKNSPKYKYYDEGFADQVVEGLGCHNAYLTLLSGNTMSILPASLKGHHHSVDYKKFK